MAWKRTRSNASYSAGYFENSILEEERLHAQLLQHGNNLKSTLAEIFTVQAAQTKELMKLKKENQRLLKSEEKLKEKVLKLETENSEKERVKECKKEPGVENYKTEKEICDMANKLADLRYELKEKDEVLVALKKELKEKDEVRVALKKELKEKDEVRIALKKELKEKDEVLLALKKELKEKDEVLLALKKELKGKDSLLQGPLKKEANADDDENDTKDGNADDDDDDDDDYDDYDDDYDYDVQEVTKGGIPLQEVKKEFIKPSAGIDHAAFKEALKRMLIKKSMAGTWNMLSLNDPQWKPFKTVPIEGSDEHEEILDLENGRLSMLRLQIGDDLADSILLAAFHEGMNKHGQHLKRRREY